MLTVLCCKWNDPLYRHNHLYIIDAEWVNKWAWSVKRNLHIPHRLVCVTDDPDGIDPCVETFPIWPDITHELLIEARKRTKHMAWAYRRLRLFSDEPMIREICGPRYVSMDLDAVVTGDLTPLFDRDDPFIGYANISVTHHPYCGALWMCNTGAFPEVWNTFTPEMLEHVDLSQMHWNGSDQVWMSIYLGPYHPTWNSDDGVYHFKIECENRPKLWKDARLVLFNGDCGPNVPGTPERHPWIAEHWRTGM